MIINQFSLIETLVKSLFNKGIRDIIISPGSRNAPIIEAFMAHGEFNLFTIPDERSAAFFALGKSIETKIPSVLLCTSGSAVLNYSPGVAEAYYQGVPMIVISADRPVEMVGQMNGQTIQQQFVLEKYTKRFAQLPQNVSTKKELRYGFRLIEDAIIQSTSELNGPVHINFPLVEPLYGNQFDFSQDHFKSIQKIEDKKSLKPLTSIWDDAERIMILVGCLHPSEELIGAIQRIVQDKRVVVLSECTSNLNIENIFPCIDQVIIPIENNPDDYRPDLLITIGRNVVSKKVKAFLSKSDIAHHWSLDRENHLIDTYGCLTAQIKLDESTFLNTFSPADGNFSYQSHFDKIHQASQTLFQSYLKDLAFCDLKVFDLLYQQIPKGSVIHYGNSSVIRYANLFDNRDKNYTCFANRGTSGIDGSMSTAVGYANSSDQQNYLIIGDMSAQYDVNALWNKHIPNNLNIIIINNGGGGIFDIIDGAKDSPANVEHLKFKHVHHFTNVPKGLNISQVSSIHALAHNNLSFHHSKNSLLEVITLQYSNADKLRTFFHQLKNI